MAHRVLGIDPGTISMGYGVVQEDADGSVVDITHGALAPGAGLPLGERLHHLFLGLQEIIEQWHPEEVAVEDPFVAKNVRSALAIGQAQGVAFMAAAARKISVHTYSPREVKQAVANYGGGTKEQVQEMVRLQLGLAATPSPSDAADALAVALCHLRKRSLARLLAQEATE